MTGEISRRDLLKHFGGLISLLMLPSLSCGGQSQVIKGSPPGYDLREEFDTSWINLNQNVIRVAKDGSKDFTSVQAATDSIKGNERDNQYTIEVYPGLYEEQVTIPNYTHLVGRDKDAVKLLGDFSGHNSLFDSAVVRSRNGLHVSVSNLTIENPGRKNPSLALYIGVGNKTDRSYVHDLRLFGGQDTVVIGDTLMERSYVKGSSDVVNLYNEVLFRDCVVEGKGTEEAFFVGNGGRFWVEYCQISDPAGFLRFKTKGATLYLRSNTLHSGWRMKVIDWESRKGNKVYFSGNNFDENMHGSAIRFDKIYSR